MVLQRGTFSPFTCSSWIKLKAFSTSTYSGSIMNVEYISFQQIRSLGHSKYFIALNQYLPFDSSESFIRQREWNSIKDLFLIWYALFGCFGIFLLLTGLDRVNDNSLVSFTEIDLTSDILHTIDVQAVNLWTINCFHGRRQICQILKLKVIVVCSPNYILMFPDSFMICTFWDYPE